MARRTSEGHAITAAPRVVVIGSGFGALFAIRALRGAGTQVTVVSRTTQHVFAPLLYQVATGLLSQGEVAPALREVVRGRSDVTVLLGDVVGIDLGRRTVEAEHQVGRSVVEYDHLIVAAGAQVSYFGHAEFAPYAPGLKSIEDALELRGRIFAAFELAEATDDEELRRQLLTFVVVGAGPTGVELAGQIAELSRRTMSRDFRRVDPCTTRVVLVDMAPTVLPGSSSDFSYWAGVELATLGVELRLGRTVIALDEDCVVLRDAEGREERLESYCKVWAAGVAASPLGQQLAEQSGARTDRSGRVEVLPDLTLPGHPEVHVVGDLMAIDGVPGVAAAAMQSRTYAAEAIRRRTRDRGAEQPFRYQDRGTLAIVARYRAIAAVRGRILHGFPAWILWLVVHLFYLVGFKNRVTTVVHWTVSFIGRGASERTASGTWPTPRPRATMGQGERETRQQVGPDSRGLAQDPAYPADRGP